MKHNFFAKSSKKDLAVVQTVETLPEKWPFLSMVGVQQ
jgi:hypothetical protein